MSGELGPDIRDKPGICFVLPGYLKKLKKEADIPDINTNIKKILKKFTPFQKLWGGGSKIVLST
jgi:hypothetical protein